MMSKLAVILRQIQNRKTPISLKGGLTLRMEQQEHMMMLAAWRVGVTPSDKEMSVLVEAVKKVFDPIVILETVIPEEARGMFALRLYWTALPLRISWLRPVNGRLFGEEE